MIVSERTARLMQTRLPESDTSTSFPSGNAQPFAILISCFFQPVTFSGPRNSSSKPAPDASYTGDFKLRQGRSAEVAEWLHADTLIMEQLRPAALPITTDRVVIEQIVAFCRETLEEGAIPVLLGYSLGKAQEFSCLPRRSRSPSDATWIGLSDDANYEQFGQSFCEYERYNANAIAGKVLICPPSANRSRMLEKIPKKRVAMISGWAVDPNAIYRYQVDAAFPLSDHADYNDLLRYVELVQPERVLTLHGFAAEFARDLRDRVWKRGR